MILVDTSVWIDHLRVGDGLLATRLDRGLVVAHPWVVGEVALGRLRDRPTVLRLLDGLPRATVADDGEVRRLVESASLEGAGIGWVDAHLLAAAMLTAGTMLWTRDARLERVARRLGCSDGGDDA